jgi:streptogramin lyase
MNPVSVEQSMKSTMLVFALLIAVELSASGQTYDTNGEVVQTFAGSAFSGYLDGVGQATMFSSPSRIVSDTSSNLFVWDSGNSRIRKITPDGTVSTFAGGGSAATGIGTNVSLGLLYTMTTDHSNAIWFLYYTGNTYLLRVRSDASVSIPATNLTGLYYNGSQSSGICFDSSNNLYYSAPAANKIYRWFTNGTLEAFVGSGNSGSIDGNGVFTSFSSPTVLCCDSADNIYVYDSGNNRIRRVNQNRDVTTITGHTGTSVDGQGINANFGSISAMVADNSGNIYLACGGSIRKMDASTNVVTMAGSFTQTGYTNGPGNLARFSSASGLCLSQGSIFVADFGNQRIRQISFNPQPQVVTGANLGIGTFAGVTITGAVGRTYQIQSSPDMSNWTTRATVLLNSSPYLWIDQNPVSGNKYYQALLLP